MKKKSVEFFFSTKCELYRTEKSRSLSISGWLKISNLESVDDFTYLEHQASPNNIFRYFGQNFSKKFFLLFLKEKKEGKKIS